jgi:uncharacterized membrane protein YoaK (UPF0700 family)
MASQRKMKGVRRTSPPDTVKAGVALLLTFTAGNVDINGFINLFQVFTAHMTGVTVHLGRDINQHHWGAAGMGAGVLAAFMAGSVAGRAIIEAGARTGLRRVASITLLLEASLLAAVALAGHPTSTENARIGFLLMLAVSMGLQTATLTRIGPLTIHTTFVTGMLNKIAQLLSEFLFFTYDIAHGKEELRGARVKTGRRAAFIWSIWVLYFCGAVVGAHFAITRGLRSLLIPAAIVVVAVAADQWRPLSVEEEQDELEVAA